LNALVDRALAGGQIIGALRQGLRLEVLHRIVGRGSDGEAGGQMALRCTEIAVDVLQRKQVRLRSGPKDDIRHLG